MFPPDRSGLRPSLPGPTNLAFFLRELRYRMPIRYAFTSSHIFVPCVSFNNKLPTTNVNAATTIG